MLKITGLKEFERNLEDLRRRASSISGTNRVSFAELFTPAFMAKNTRFASMDALIEASGHVVDTEDDFEAIPDQEWEAHVIANTRFGSWQEMQQSALADWTKRRLGFS